MSGTRLFAELSLTWLDVAVFVPFDPLEVALDHRAELGLALRGVHEPPEELDVDVHAVGVRIDVGERMLGLHGFADELGGAPDAVEADLLPA